MSIWPEALKVGPIGSWPGALRNADRRVASPFSSTLTKTLQLLDREIYFLADTRTQQESAEVLVAIPVGAFTKDGRPYARAVAEHPGIIFSMDTRHGRVSYPCDKFTRWEDNLRAVALALEALRKVDRYGVTSHGEQYRGFLAIEGRAVPGAFSVDYALAFIGEIVYMTTEDVRADPKAALRYAKRAAHPDTGGNADRWASVQRAEEALRNGGLL